MSFGCGVGDILALGKLVRDLYLDYYLVSRGAPNEFRALVEELKTLFATYHVLEVQYSNPRSLINNAGNDRKRMINDLLGNLKATLTELYEMFNKHRKLVTEERVPAKRCWDKLKWAADVKNAEGLRQKLAYHNGVLSLLLTCVGNSSLERVETVTQAIQNEITQLKEFTQQMYTGGRPLAPMLGSGTTDSNPIITSVSETFREAFSKQCFAAAEVDQRRWKAIGIEYWINTGRWWLLKAQVELSSIKEGQVVPKEPCLQLLKASWILSDIIMAHPQLNDLDTMVYSSVQRLIEAVNLECRKLQKAKFPVLHIDDCNDICIWDGVSRAPTLNPRSDLGDNENTWTMPEYHVLLRCFATYQAEHRKAKTPCMVMFLLDKKSKEPRLLVIDQEWWALVELRFTVEILVKICSEISITMNSVKIGVHELVFEKQSDCIFLHLMLIVYVQYRLVLDTSALDLNCHYVLMLLLAMHGNLIEAVKYLLDYDSSFAEDAPLNSQHLRDTVRAKARKMINSNEQGVTPGWATLAANSDDSFLRWMLHQERKEILVEFLKNLQAVGNPNYAMIEADQLTPGGEICEKRENIFILWLTPGFRFKMKSNDLLLKAAAYGHSHAVAVLLAQGSDIDTLDKLSQNTPLYNAITNGRCEVIRLLLASGATWEFNNFGVPRTPFLWVLEHTPSHLVTATLKALRDGGISIDTPNINGRSILVHEVESRKHAAVCMANIQVLVADLGADVGIRYNVIPPGTGPLQYFPSASAESSFWATVLQLAAHEGNTVALGALLYAIAGNPTSLADPSYSLETDVKKALFFAARQGHTEVVTMLLKSKYSVDALCTEPDVGNYINPHAPNFHVLHVAIQAQRERLVEHLLSPAHGIPVNVRSRIRTKEGILDYECTPLETALRAFQIDYEDSGVSILRYLIRSRADVNARDNEGNTGLHCFARRRFQGNRSRDFKLRIMSDVIRILVNAGANINAQGSLKATPLHHCFKPYDPRYLDPDIVTCFLNAGARVDIKDLNGFTALDYAIQSFTIDDVPADWEYPFARYGVPWIFIRTKYAQIKSLLRHGANASEGRGPQKATALHLLVRAIKNEEKFEELVEELFERRINGKLVEWQDNRVKRPPTAPAFNCIDLMLLLLKYGADPRVKDSDGKTPLDLAQNLGQKTMSKYLSLIKDWLEENPELHKRIIIQRVKNDIVKSPDEHQEEGFVVVEENVDDQEEELDLWENISEGESGLL